MYDDLFQKSKAVLAKNDRGGWTVPAGDLYPHQWLWDSCFISIGLRHYDVVRAQTELRSLLRGQWQNGMFPDIIFSDARRKGLDLDELLWDSSVNQHAPNHVDTSGVSQPPMLAEAVWRVGEKLDETARLEWFREMLPPIIKFHQWLYNERDPRGEGLITVIHPYESGLDDSPAWLDELEAQGAPRWINIGEKLGLGIIVNLIRRDTRHADSSQRMSNMEALSFFVALRRLRKQKYDSKLILANPYLAIQDLVFNCILIRANQRLAEIAKAIGEELPGGLAKQAKRHESAIEKLWDEEAGQYFSRSFSRKELIKEPSVATFMPLYAGCISPAHAKQLVNLLNDKMRYAPTWPIPSVPLDSPYFNDSRYWQGPTWINMNWLIIDGLERYGFKDEAKDLRDKTLRLVEQNGCSEYYNPLTGAPNGAKNFSWTAALSIDLLKS